MVVDFLAVCVAATFFVAVFFGTDFLAAAFLAATFFVDAFFVDAFLVTIFSSSLAIVTHLPLLMACCWFIRMWTVGPFCVWHSGETAGAIITVIASLETGFVSDQIRRSRGRWRVGYDTDLIPVLEYGEALAELPVDGYSYPLLFE